MPLCSTCNALDLFSCPSFPVSSRNFETIRKNASLGCDLCALIFSVAFDHVLFITKELDLKNTPKANFKTEDCDFTVHLWLSGNGLSVQKPLYNKLLVTVTGKDKSWPDQTSFLTSRQTNFPHEICVAADPELPTRCIEVTPTAAYLRDTQGTTGSYVTLSHRWNPEAEAVKTTSANFQQRMSGTELGLLSKTFEDAITIVRKLEIRYIWIDSICIIQGTDDWNQEKFKMGQYYERALLTLSAIGGCIQAGKDSGILKAQPPKSLVRLAFKENGIRKGSVFLYRRDDKASFLTDVTRSELISRGWVFQERLLSKRIIYFTNKVSFLECCSEAPRSFCNDMITKVPRPWEAKSSSNVSRILPTHSLKLNLAWDYDPLTMWYNIVTGFSKTILTQQSDHFAAISGAAFEYGKALERKGLKKSDKRWENTKPTQDYLSGLWLEDIHYGLMWFVVDHQNRECPCGAPSWSWLSNQGEVEWQPRDDTAQPSLQVLGAEYEEEAQGIHRLPEVVTMTTKLRVKVKMQPLLIMPGIQDVKGMSKLTGLKVQTSLCNQYYTICHPSSPDWAGGWAKFERDPRVAELNNTSSGIAATLAIHVASRQFMK
ncbi:het-domain-containing protein [Fusarium mundagurra]|uniref:Het-domain-containing protein n=1 Tax=Fusarium mundagurra TaxID=1567541 RepID=A0A8H5YWP9_9HYPO|nr:het-domain-containing protein [Fusarium mundagurra]